MQPKAEDILRDKENKIKMLFNEFETLKKKIFICEQERKEEPNYSNSVRPNKTQQSRRQIQKSPRKEPQSDLMKLKVEKYEQLLRERTQIFQDKERYLQKALKQQKINLQILRQTYEKKLRRANKITIPWAVQQLIDKIKMPTEIEQKIAIYDKRMQLLSQMLTQLRKAIDIKIQKSSQDLQEVITQKIKIELQLAQKQQLVRQLKDKIQQNSRSYRQNQVINKLRQIEQERQEQSKLFQLRVRQLEQQLENQTLQKQKLILKQMQLQKQVDKPNRQQKLQKQLKQVQQQLMQLQNEHNQTVKQLHSSDQNNNQLKLELDTLQRQNKLAISNYQSQIMALKEQCSSATETINKLESQIAKVEQDHKKHKNQYENRIAQISQQKTGIEQQLAKVRRQCSTKDEQLNKLRQDRQDKKGPNMQTRRQIEGYQRQIEQLKIMLSALQDQIDKGGQEENKKLKQSLCMRESEVNKLTDKCQRLNKQIQDLKSIKPAFQQAMIDINQNSSELKMKMMKPRRDKIIARTMNDMPFREIRSEDGKQLLDQRLEQFNEEPPVVAPHDSPAHKNHRSMLYSVNLTNQKHLLDKIKTLEKQLQLATVEKEFQTNKREKLEQELKSMEVDQQRFQNQKDLLKQQLNLVNHEMKTLKDQVKKLIELILVENRKAFKANVEALRTTINQIISSTGSERQQGALKHQLKIQIEEKKGIFYG